VENMVAGVSTPLPARLTGICMFFDQVRLEDVFTAAAQSANSVSMFGEGCG
jgi:hypothetical protein